MNSRTQHATRCLFLALASLASILGTTASAQNAAASAATPAPATAPVQPLDEIVVHGKRLKRAIADAEDSFFVLYNQLNRDHDYDTNCVYLRTSIEDPDSQIASRVCIPGFLADAVADEVYFSAECQAPTDGSGTQYSPLACYTPPPPQLLLVERSNDYARNLRKVINSDPRLQQMAGHLDDLYHEMASVRQQYILVRTMDQPSRTPAPPNPGPRTH